MVHGFRRAVKLRESIWLWPASPTRVVEKQDSMEMGAKRLRFEAPAPRRFVFQSASEGFLRSKVLPVRTPNSRHLRSTQVNIPDGTHKRVRAAPESMRGGTARREMIVLSTAEGLLWRLLREWILEH
jgi:hypothetical protein